MAIKNTKLGGTDWSGEATTDYDLNDTFDAAADYITGLTSFWLNTDLYDVYDDFDGESTGAFTTNTNWTITAASGGGGANGYADIVDPSTMGTGKMLTIKADDDGAGGPHTASLTATAKNLTDNLHTYCKWHIRSDAVTENGTLKGTIKVGNAIDGYTTIVELSGISGGGAVQAMTYTGDLFIVAKGSNVYDVYWNWDKTNLTLSNGLEIQFIAYISCDYSDGFVYIDIDDVLQSKSSL